jgi:hypothetical protein
MKSFKFSTLAAFATLTLLLSGTVRAMANHLKSELVLDALDMALGWHGSWPSATSRRRNAASRKKMPRIMRDIRGKDKAALNSLRT